MLRVLVLVPLVLLVSCGDEERRVPVLSARQTADNALRLEVGACDRDLVVITVEELAEVVRLTASSNEAETEDDCGAALLTVTLAGPSGTRQLVDNLTDEVVPVRG